jgi:hypothetical protein
MQITFSERELEDFLCTGKNLEKYLGLKFVARQVRIEPIGIIDILAYHKASTTWVIIELKKGVLDPNSFCQISSYVNFYKETKSLIDVKNFRRERTFCGLLVGDSLDSNLHKCVSHYSTNDDWIKQNLISYCLFNMSFTDGIDFTYYDKSQKIIEDRIGEIGEINDINRWNKHNLAITQ